MYKTAIALSILFLGAPAIWVLPVAFPVVMAAGGLIGLLGFPLHGVEIAIGAGLLHGLVNGATMAPAGAVGLALGGAVSAIFFLTAVVSAEVTALPAGWPRIAALVAGSWIAASGLLMFGWRERWGDVARGPGRTADLRPDLRT